MHLEAGRVHDVSTIGQRWQSSGTGCSLGGSASGSFGPDARRDQLFLGLDLGGKILVEGDASRLLMLQAEPPGDDAIAMYQRLADLTAPDPD